MAFLDSSTIFMLTMAIASGALVALRYPERLSTAWQRMLAQGRLVAFRLPAAMLAAALVSHGIASTGIESLISSDSGITGILIACAIGAIMPGGPMVAFPMALAFWRLGAGEVQMVAFLAAWSIYSVSRVISFELPLMGWRFLVVRLASGGAMPLLAALLAWGLIQLR